MLPPDSLDDEKGNCKRCGHPFNPHTIVAYDNTDLSKGGEMRCPVENCQCFSAVSFDMPTTSSPINTDFAGMTTNERLYSAGLMPEWDDAAYSRNREKMIEILGRVGLAGQADNIAENVLADPKRYGF
jgi:hypothetical protein